MLPRMLFFVSMLILSVKINIYIYKECFQKELCNDGFYSKKPKSRIKKSVKNINSYRDYKVAG